MVAVRPAIAAYIPSCATTQAPATAAQLPATPVSSSPTTKTSTPPATQTRRLPQWLRVRSQSAPKTGRATSAATPAAPLTSPKSSTLCAGSTSASCSGSSNWTGANCAAHSPSQASPKWSVQARPTRSVGSNAWAGTAAAGTVAMSAPPGGPEDPVQVGIAQHTRRVQPVAEGGELVEPRIPGPQCRGVQAVQLAPVRAAADAAG